MPKNDFWNDIAVTLIQQIKSTTGLENNSEIMDYIRSGHNLLDYKHIRDATAINKYALKKLVIAKTE